MRRPPLLKVQVEPPSGDPYCVVLASLPVRIGRSPKSELRLEDPFASRFHAELEAAAEGYLLCDLGSGNGTFVNGERIAASAAVGPGDVLRVGSSVLRLELAEVTAGDGPPAAASSADFVARPRLLRREPSAAHPRAAGMETVLQAVREAASGSGQQPVIDHRNQLFAVLSKVGMALLSPAELEVVLHQILDLTFEAVEAERAFLLLRAGILPEAMTAEGGAEEGHGGQGEGAMGLVLKLASFRGGRAAAGEREVRISASILDEVVEKGRPVLTSDAQADARFKDKSSIIISGVRSVMAAPLALEDRVLGLIYLDSPVAANVFSEDDLRMLSTIAGIAAIKVENAVLLEERLRHERLVQQLANAREIQSRLLPVAPPQLPGYELAGVSFPCWEVGGDYYDFIERASGRLLLTLGDVSGKGLDASLLMSGLHAALRVEAGMGASLPELVAGVNRFLHGNSPANRFVTLFAAELDPAAGRLLYVNAGHNPALLVRRSGDVEELAACGLPLGIRPACAYPQQAVRFAAGDVLVVYSDGVSEAANGEGEEFTALPLIGVVRRYQGALASELQELMTQELDHFLGAAARTDDMTLLVVRRAE